MKGWFARGGAEGAKAPLRNCIALQTQKLLWSDQEQNNHCVKRFS